MDLEGRKPLQIARVRCSRLVEPVERALIGEGLWAFESFDLRSVRALHEGCSCPHHGSAECTCEMVVLLVYPAAGDPVSLVLDGRDGQTCVFIAAETAGAPPASAVEMIGRAVNKAVGSLVSPP